MLELNAIGLECPKPVIEAKKAWETGATAIRVLVDNTIAVENLTRFAENNGAESEVEQQGNVFAVQIKRRQAAALKEARAAATGRMVVAIGSDKMGEGAEALGRVLIKGFLFALTQLDETPEAVLLYNSGAMLSTEGSSSIADLKTLEENGAKIVTCGTCLKHYGLEEKLSVGAVTNMYSIVETLAGAGRILRP